LSEHSHHHPHGESPRRPPWKLIIGVAIALAAMGIYVLTMDEAVQPVTPTQGPVPAAE
jgi:hypothetical protein